jgi:DNA-binding LacI/PurR family transcriptional regulator
MAGKVTIAKIAKKAGVSPTTVSFVLNGQDMGISDETVKSVLAIAAAAGYKRKSASRTGWTRVAYLSSDLNRFSFYTTFFSGVYAHLQRIAPAQKIEPFLLEFDSASKEATMKLHEIVNSAGFEVFLSNEHNIVEFLKKNDKKAILIQGGASEDIMSIYCDDFEAGRVAAKFAIQKGYKTAGTLFPEYGADGPRFKGFVETFIDMGGNIPEEFQWEVTFDHELASRKIAKLAKKSNLPSFFYCFADNLMFPMIRGLAKTGKKVPDDVSIMGTDNLYWGKVSSPAFTTVDLSEELFAEKVVEGIQHLKKGGNPYSLAVPVMLIERETVRDNCSLCESKGK